MSHFDSVRAPATPVHDVAVGAPSGGGVAGVGGRRGADEFVRAAGGPLLVAGGSGVVGRHLLGLLARAYPGREVVVLSRDAARAAGALESHPRARFVRLDLGGAEGVRLEAAALVTLVNDPADRLLVAAARGGVPIVDVSRWTSRVSAATARAASLAPRAPVVLSSGWMGGLAPRVAAALARRLPGPPESVDIAVRYSLADAAGDDSVAYLDRLGLPFEAQIGGERRAVAPLSDGRSVDVGGRPTRVYRIDTPEQLTLPLTLGAATVSTRIGFDSAAATLGLWALTRAGVFCALRGDRWAGLRRSLLHTNGSGGEALFRTDVAGAGRATALTVIDPLGQAHLTALGALLSLRFALEPATRAGVVFPEEDPANEGLLASDEFGRAGVELCEHGPARAAA